MNVLKSVSILAVIGFIATFDLGTRYVYKYDTKVGAIEPDVQTKSEKKLFIGYQISADVHLTSVWENPSNTKENLIQIQIFNPRIASPEEASDKMQKQALEHYNKIPLYVQRIRGQVQKVFAFAADIEISKNMKKAIGSILQYHVETKDAVQSDISGICNITYAKADKEVVKIKTNCLQPSQKSTSYKHLAQYGNILKSAEVVYEMISDEGDMFRSAKATDAVELFTPLWKGNKIGISSETSLVLADEREKVSAVDGRDVHEAVKSLETKHGETIVEVKIYSRVDLESGKKSTNNLLKTVKHYKKNLGEEHLAQVTSASTFLKLLKHFRSATKEEIINVLKAKEIKSVLPQVLDVVAFARIPEAVEAAFETLDFLKSDSAHLERFLLSLSLLTRPSQDLLQRILTVLKKPVKDQKIKAALLSALGALSKTTSLTVEDGSQKVLQEVTSFLEKGLKSCKSEECQVSYLRGLRNAALSNTVPVLVDFACKDGKPAYEALLALRSIGSDNSTILCGDLKGSIFRLYQTSKDSSNRIIAAQILLECNLEKHDWKYLLSSLTDQEKPEISTFIAFKLTDKMQQETNVRNEVLKVLSSEEVKHYYAFSQKGSSVSFTRPLIVIPEVNSSFSLSLEMLPGGLLRRSSFDVNVAGPSTNFPFLSIGIFADGLGSLAGEDTSETNEAPYAALELSTSRVALRPYVLFEGTSELMGHVWSGTASTPTPALQGNFHVFEELQVHVLQNGIPVQLNIDGVLSSDLSASIQISLWNRNSHSEVKNRHALLLTAGISVDPNIFVVKDTLTLNGQTAIEFVTDFDFYTSPFKMCLQMMQPEFPFKIHRRTSIHATDSAFMRKKKKTRHILVPGRSYAFHRKNCELCSSMLREDF